MLILPAAPHADQRSSGFVSNEWGATRIRETVEHDQRGGAGRMCRREQRRGRERGVRRDENRFATPEVVEHRGDAVGPLLQGRQRPGVTGSDAPVPGWSKKMSRPSDVIASTHP